MADGTTLFQIENMCFAMRYMRDGKEGAYQGVVGGGWGWVGVILCGEKCSARGAGRRRYVCMDGPNLVGQWSEPPWCHGRAV